jgi:ABC-type transport system substrate-binding protein
VTSEHTYISPAATWPHVTRRDVLRGAMALGAGALAASCGGGGGGGGGRRSLVYAQSVVLNTVDPAGQELVYPGAQEASLVIFDTLLTFDRGLNLKPQLLTKWSVASDQRTWTLQLRKGVPFHDGHELDAEAVRSHALREQTNPTSGYPEWRTEYESFAVVDRYTVRFVTKKPWGPILRYWARVDGGIPSPAATARWGAQFGTHPVGTGPYRLISFEPGTSLKLTAFDKYWGGRPKLAGIEFRGVTEDQTRVDLLSSGEADVIDNVPPDQAKSIAGGANTTLLRVPSLWSFYLEFNQNVPLFQDVNVRRALNYAIDKRTIVDNLFSGYARVLDSPAPAGIPGHVSVGGYAHDRGKATSMLGKAGWSRGAGGVLQRGGQAMRFNLMTPQGQFPQDLAVAQSIQADLKAIGCDVSLKTVDASSFFALVKQPPDKAQYDTLLFGFNPSNGDLGYHLDSLFRSNPSRASAPQIWNAMWYQNPKVDSLLDEADVTLDGARRVQILEQAQHLIWEDAPAAFLYVPDLLAGARKDVAGAFLWPTIFLSLHDASKGGA